MKTAISLPDSVFKQADELAQRFGLSRSELYTKALKAYLTRYSRDQILHKLNQVYASESSKPDPVMAKMQLMSLSQLIRASWLSVLAPCPTIYKKMWMRVCAQFCTYSVTTIQSSASRLPSAPSSETWVIVHESRQ
jgi:predicted transcriptional regulator